MKYIVIRAKDDDEEQEILDLLDGRNLEWTEVSDPREYADNQFSVHMTDGVLFTLSYDPNQSSTDNNLPSTSYGLQDIGVLSDRSNHHQSHSQAMNESSRYDAPQYPYSQPSAHGYGRYTNYQSHPLAMSEINGYGAQQYDNSQPLNHNYGGYPRNNIYIENGNDGLAMEPSTSAAPKRPMDDKDSKETNDYTNQAKKPRRRIQCSPDDIQCRLCSEMFSSRNKYFSFAQRHAVIHEDSLGNKEMFDCPVDGCNFSHCWMFEVRSHFNKKHKDCELLETDLKLTDEQQAKWVRHVNECFPEMNNKKVLLGEKKCKLCGDEIVNEILKLRQHAIEDHIGKIRYKCDRCDFKSKYRVLVAIHQTQIHGIKSDEVTELPLTDDQEKELADMIKQCFPDEE